MELKTRILASAYHSEGGVSILVDRFNHKINFFASYIPPHNASNFMNLFLFYMYKCLLVDMSVYHVLAVPAETKRGGQSPCNGSYS